MTPVQDILYICLKSIPSNTPKNEPLYLAGNFNKWQTADEKYRFFRGKDGFYQVAIPRSNLMDIEFKINRGTWKSVEGGEFGQEIPNHQVQFPDSRACFITNVLTWKDLPQENPFQIINPQVSIYESYIFMPQLKRERQIWVYLPPDYRQNSSKHYPVIYMQDGQNLFANIHKGQCNWSVDTALNYLYEQSGQGAIVVGIGNDNEHRVNEYAPWQNSQEEGGEGMQYAKFLIETLKPLIDRSFRTLPQQENTAIMGSSMGGLISLYAALEYPHIFGKAGILSPSLWFTDDIYDFVQETEKQFSQRILLMGCREEDNTMLTDLLAMYQVLQNKGYSESEIHLEFHYEGERNEWFWAQEFRYIFEWLFEMEYTQPSDTLMAEKIKILQNSKSLHIELEEVPENLSLELYNQKGKRLLRRTLNQLYNEVSLDKIKDTIHFIKFFVNQDLYYLQELDAIAWA